MGVVGSLEKHMNIGNTDIGVGKKRIFERVSSEPYCRMGKRSRHADEIALHSVSPLSTGTPESFESGGRSEADDEEAMEIEEKQGDNIFEVDQYCENELQHDKPEEDLNQGHTNTQRKSRTSKPVPYKRRVERIPWDDRIQDLKDFKETFGHCRVKQRFKDNPALATFVTTMRNYKNKTKRGTCTEASFLTPARINELDELGFEWLARLKTFEDHIDELKAFKELHGHIRVTNALDRKLAGFCMSMREARRNPESGRMTITEERIKALNDLGFKWKNALKQSFEERVEQLEAFKEVHGHLRVVNAVDKNLAAFCNSMREARRNPASGRMIITKERIKALDDLGFGWGAKRMSK